MRLHTQLICAIVSCCVMPVVAGTLMSGSVAAQAPRDSPQRVGVRAIEQRWLAHEQDVDSLTVILGDDFLHVLPSGIVTKAEQLGFMRAHPMPGPAAAHFSELRVRVYHTVGVATGIVDATDRDGHERRTAFTDVLVERDGRWEAVNAQESPLAIDSIPPDLSRDVRAGNQAWIDGLKAGDAAQVADSYASDAVFCPAAGACLTGRSAVVEHYRSTIQRLGRATSASVRSAGLRVDGDLAYESGAAEARFANGQTVAGRYSSVWKRAADGHWRIFRNMSL